LNDLGFNSGEEDGIFGAKTNNAVTSFQRQFGLVADGVVGPKTWSKLLGISVI
jgi:peptidoglycan hydrolase-like protein with peptidoglycan-binding domain